MAIVEGSGMKAPSPVEVKLKRGDIAYLVRVAREHAAKYRNSGTKWGRGVNQDPLVIEGWFNIVVEPGGTPAKLVGLLGEVAFARKMSDRLQRKVAADLRVLQRGDPGYDFEIAGEKIEIRTRRKRMGANLVRGVREDGSTVPIKADIFVFCDWDGKETCRILGWMYARDLRGYQLQPAPRRESKHLNYVVPDADLKPLTRLVSLLEARETDQCHSFDTLDQRRSSGGRYSTPSRQTS